MTSRENRESQQLALQDGLLWRSRWQGARYGAPQRQADIEPMAGGSILVAQVIALAGLPDALPHSNAAGGMVRPIAGHANDPDLGRDCHLVFTAENTGRCAASQLDPLASSSKLLLHYASKGPDRQAAISAGQADVKAEMPGITQEKHLPTCSV